MLGVPLWIPGNNGTCSIISHKGNPILDWAHCGSLGMAFRSLGRGEECPILDSLGANLGPWVHWNLLNYSSLRESHSGFLWTHSGSLGIAFRSLGEAELPETPDFCISRTDALTWSRTCCGKRIIWQIGSWPAFVQTTTETPKHLLWFMV